MPTTHRIAEQTIDTNLRPIILRSGFIRQWDDVSFKIENGQIKEGNPLQFTILKNIARDIEGYVVVRHKKHTLLFGSYISKIGKKDGQNLLQFESRWGWMNSGTVIYAVFNTKDSVDVPNNNHIRLTYRDVEGNFYFTEEDKNFSQTLGKL